MHHQQWKFIVLSALLCMGIVGCGVTVNTDEKRFFLSVQNMDSFTSYEQDKIGKSLSDWRFKKITDQQFITILEEDKKAWQKWLDRIQSAPTLPSDDTFYGTQQALIKYLSLTVDDTEQAVQAIEFHAYKDVPAILSNRAVGLVDQQLQKVYMTMDLDQIPLDTSEYNPSSDFGG